MRIRRVVLSFFCLLAAVALLQHRLLYNNWGPIFPFPPHRLVEVEDIWFTGVKGVRLHGWFAACPSTLHSAVGPERPVVLFCHGNGGSLPRWRWVAARWQDALGADVLLFDYPGYGSSEGRPDEPGLYDSAHAAYGWLTRERGVDSRRIIIVGQSLGGAVAVELAASVEHRMLILESTFTSVPDIVDGVCFGLPLGRLARDVYPSERRLGGYRKPLFLSHGTADRLIGVSQAVRLKAQAKGPSELLLVQGMGHHDARPNSYGAEVRRFVQANW